ncbi:GGDEF domain-containing protein [Nitrincola sp. A-D6]|uniref:GGDEF domain-containing protein n=1 Tax=Nitrincola sp. A-D6 TaxID=1545442 RepID=UPI0006894874|nr:GGDEF domain-containing protein [Nitrincola sp. A-D6]
MVSKPVVAESEHQLKTVFLDSKGSLFIANSALQQMREAVLITDENSCIIMVNQAFTDITGFSQQDVIGKKPSIFSSGRHASPFYKSMWDALEQGGWWSGKIWNRRKNAEVYPQWVNITRIYDQASSQTLYVAVFSDLSSNKEQEVKFDRMAHYDVLTGLPNRSLFMGLAEHAVNRSKRYSQKMAMLFIDLDKFKGVNDEFGHHEGDSVLAEAAERISSCLRDSDLVARLGGDEFVVILENIHRNHANKVASKLIDELVCPFELNGRQHRLGASIGMVFYPDHGDSVDDLLRRLMPQNIRLRKKAAIRWLSLKCRLSSSI